MGQNLGITPEQENAFANLLQPNQQPNMPMTNLQSIDAEFFCKL